MGQTGAINNVRVATKHRGYLATDLRDFKRVGQSSTSEIVGSGDKYLRFGSEPTKRR
jgi:hypothetical protein